MLAVLLAGCRLPLGECTVLCGESARCPRGLSCGQDGYCHGDGTIEDCSDMAGDRDGGASCVGCATGGPYNLVFVTSGRYLPGRDFVGLQGADAECQKLADGAGIGVPMRHYRAWLSTSLVDAKTRLVTPAGSPARGWIRPDGRPFGDSLATLLGLGGQVFYPPRLDEAGRDVIDTDPDSYALTATGTGSDGTADAATASDWVSANVSFHSGAAVGTTSRWTDTETLPPQAVHLYCFGTDFDQPLHITRVDGRIAFVTRGKFPSAILPMSMANADTQCQQEGAALAAGTYRALLSTTNTAATDRLDLTGRTWVRPDGIPWLEKASDLRDGRPLTGLSVDSTGTYVYFDDVWTGAPSPSSTSPTGAHSCADWTSTSSTGDEGQPTYTNQLQFTFETNQPCTPRSLYCLQDQPL
jgi:hypothetical protein